MRSQARCLAVLWLLAAPGCSQDAELAASPKTMVKVIDGVPRILIDGTDGLKTGEALYYNPYVDRKTATVLNRYADGGWLTGVKKIIDGMQDRGANALWLQFFWQELDTSKSRPSDLGAALNYGPLDAALDYARSKGIYIMLTPRIDTFLPAWFVAESRYPEPMDVAFNPCIPQERTADHACIPVEICAAGDSRCCSQAKAELYCCRPATASDQAGGPAQLGADGLPRCTPIGPNPKYSGCSDCETDSYGWKYSTPSWASATFRDDYAAVLTALVKRYKAHPAVMGWDLELGPTGEDNYGPSYIAMRMIYGHVMGAAKTDQVSDYSETAQKQFADWIAIRYASDAALQAAWGDPSVTLSRVRLPDPRKLFQPGVQAPFPDNFYTGIFVRLDQLTTMGRDLYDFREHVRDQTRKVFTRAIKQNDPDHILSYSGSNNDAIFANPDIDAINGHNHIEYALSQYGEDGVLAVMTALQTKHGKASIFGLESDGGGSGGLAQSGSREQQHDALRKAAQTVLCSGGYFGAAVSIPEINPNYPTWTDAELPVLQEIASYQVTAGCACDLVRPADTCLTMTVAQAVSLFQIQGQYTCR